MTTSIPYWAALLYGLLAAAAVALGGGLVFGPVRGMSPPARDGLASLGAGFLIALGVLGALPESLEETHGAGMMLPLALALASLVLMLLLHRVGHGGAGDHAHDHAHGHARTHAHSRGPEELSLHDARMAVMGLALHSLLDGVAVSAALASERELGLFVALLVLLHKVPEGAAAAAITYASGGELPTVRRHVLTVALASALGTLAILAVGPVLAYALAITAGVTTGVGIGIATHLVRREPRRAVLGIGAGLLLFALSEALLHG